MWRELYMDVPDVTESEAICYNKRVSQMWNVTIFDIGPEARSDDGYFSRFGVGGPNMTVVGRRVFAPSGRPGVAGNAYATAYLCFRENHYFSRMRQKYGVAPCGNHAAQPLSSASSRLVVVPLGNRISRVRRFSFPRRSGVQ